MRQKYMAVLAAVLSMLLTACAPGVLPFASGTGDVPTTDATQQSEEIQSPDAADDTMALVTEEDFRTALQAVADDTEKLSVYRDFFENFRMQENEYIDFAKLLEQAGDSVMQRKVLYTLYCMDPTEAHGQLMSDMTLKLTPQDDAKAEGLLNSLLDELKKCDEDGFSTEGLKAITDSADWKESFFIDNGTFTSHTEFEGETLQATIDSDSLGTKAVLVSDNTRYLCDLSYAGETVGKVALSDGKAEGAYCLLKLSDDGGNVETVSGEVRDGHYVNQITVVANGTTYTGTFDDAGKTKEEQPQGLKGCAYAYSKDGNRYLYIADVNASDFVANIADMGFTAF